MIKELVKIGENPKLTCMNSCYITQSVHVLMLLIWRHNLAAKLVRCCLLSMTAINFHPWINGFSKRPVVNSQNGSTRLLPISHSSGTERAKDQELQMLKSPYKSPIPGYIYSIYIYIYWDCSMFMNRIEQTLKIPIYYHFLSCWVQT